MVIYFNDRISDAHFHRATCYSQMLSMFGEENKLYLQPAIWTHLGLDSEVIPAALDYLPR